MSDSEDRQWRRLPLRIAPPGPSGNVIRFVELHQNSASQMSGDIYNRRMKLVRRDVSVSHRGGHYGYYFKGHRYACVRTPNPVQGSEGVEHYTIIQGGAFYAAGVLTEDMEAADNPHATLQLAEGVTITVLDVLGDNPPDRAKDISGGSGPVLVDVQLAIAGDRIGAQWRRTSADWRWDISCQICTNEETG